MHQWNDLHESLGAPSPIVPTCRPSPPSSKRKQYSMANLSSKQEFLESSAETQAETQQNPPGSSDSRKNENVVELVGYIQMQNGSTPVSQSSGARDIFKAGQRRLRQLAQRQRKDSEPRTKETRADEAARHLRALQREGFLPPSSTKNSAPKKSLDSALSGARSVSNFSSMSSSRRDVESIGQPWLERQNTQDSMAGLMSSLDLTDLSTLVEAVNFDDTNPPPYQASEEPCDYHFDDQSPTALPPIPDHPPPTPTPQQQHNADPTSEPAENAEGSGTPKPQDTSSNETSGEQKERKSESASKGKSANLQPPNPPPLKLFPDALSPRISSKSAWRISNCRLPLPNAPGAESQQGSSESNSRPGSTRPSIEDRLPGPGKPTEGNEKSGKKKRRPASLQMSAINAFPLPAPMRPLPSLPGSTDAGQEKNPSGKRQGNGRPAELPTPPLPSPRDIPKTSPVDNASSQATERLQTVQEQRPELHKAPDSVSTPPNSPPIARSRQSRAERVRALKLKDMSVSRFYLTGADRRPSVESQVSPRTQNFKAQDMPRRSEDVDNDKRQRIVSDVPSPPPRSPLPARPSRANNQSFGKWYCTSPAGSVAASHERAPDSRKGLYDVNRSNSTRTARVRLESMYNEKENTIESSLPSSDDECMGSGAKYPQQQQSNSKRKSRKSKAHGANLHVSSRKPAPNYLSSAIPSNRSSRNFEKSPTSPKCQDCQRGMVKMLEGRIAQLERQNKVLQAALLAALDAGSKQDLNDVFAASAATPLSASATSSANRTSSSTNNSPDLPAPGQARQPRKESVQSDRQDRNVRNSFETSCTRENAKELQELVSGFEFGWTLDEEAQTAQTAQTAQN